MTTVRHEEPRAFRVRRRWDIEDTAIVAMAVLLSVIGILGWLADARYTAGGWLTAISAFTEWLGQPVSLALPTEPRAFFLIIALIGLVYSLVEFGCAPVTWKRHRQHHTRSMVVFGFAFAIVTDLVTTVVDVLLPSAASAPVELWLAQVWPLAIVWALLIAFLPELALLAAWSLVKNLRG